MGRDIKYFKIENLEQYLIEHKQYISFVCLQWEWTNNRAHVETDTYGILDSDKHVCLYAEFSYTEVDFEYSYIGDVDGAIEYASGYGVWDGRMVYLDGGVLYGKISMANPDGSISSDIDVLQDASAIDIEYLGLAYYSRGKRHMYDGPVYKLEGADEAA